MLFNFLLHWPVFWSWFLMTQLACPGQLSNPASAKACYSVNVSIELIWHACELGRRCYQTSLSYLDFALLCLHWHISGLFLAISNSRLLFHYTVFCLWSCFSPCNPPQCLFLKTYLVGKVGWTKLPKFRNGGGGNELDPQSTHRPL